MEVSMDSEIYDNNDRELWIVTLAEHRYKKFKAAYYACDGKYAAEYAQIDYPVCFVESWQSAKEYRKWK